MLKWIAPAVLSLGMLGALGSPAQAQGYRYRGDNVYQGRVFSGNRGEEQRRMELLMDRVNRLFEEGRLSREHRDRAIAKLGRIRQDVRSRDRITEDRHRANMEWMDGISEDVENWSRADSRHHRIFR
jgi:hypothetical protein